MRITRSLTSSTSAGLVESVIETLWICLRASRCKGAADSAEPPAPPAESSLLTCGNVAGALLALPLLALSLPPPDCDATPMISANTATTAPTAEIACRFGRTVCHCHQRGGDGNRSATRRSILPAQAGAGSGRAARTSASRSKGSGIEGLPELVHGAVDERAGVGHADADQLGDLGVGQLGVVLERDQLALARAQLAERDAHRLLLGGQLRRLAGVRLRRRDGKVRRRHALAPAKLVQRRVARDPEQPGARASLAGVKAASALVGALEGRGGDVLGRRPVTEQRGRVGVDVVARISIERVEVQRPGRGCVDDGCRHTLTTTLIGNHHNNSRAGFGLTSQEPCGSLFSQPP